MLNGGGSRREGSPIPITISAYHPALNLGTAVGGLDVCQFSLGG